MKDLMKTAQDQLNTFYLNYAIFYLIEDSHLVKPIIATIFGGVITGMENNEYTQSMFNKTTLIQTNINKIFRNMTPHKRNFLLHHII